VFVEDLVESFSHITRQSERFPIQGVKDIEQEILEGFEGLEFEDTGRDILLFITRKPTPTATEFKSRWDTQPFSLLDSIAGEYFQSSPHYFSTGGNADGH